MTAPLGVLCAHGLALKGCADCWPAFETERARRGARGRHSVSTSANQVVDRIGELTDDELVMIAAAVDREQMQRRRHANRCTAHGARACPRCSRNASTCATGNGGCATYADTGMHWDTCPNRVR